MPRYRIEFECEEHEVDAVVADGRWELKEVEPDAVGSKYVTTVHVEDPDTEGLVEVEIRKMDTGPMVGFDGAYLEQIDDHPFSPYDQDTIIVVPDDEDAGVTLVNGQNPMNLDSSELADQQRQIEKFSPPESE